MLAPSGYSRCREPEEQPFGMSLVSRRCKYSGYEDDENSETKTTCCKKADEDDYSGDRTPDQVNALRDRTRFYLAMHVIFGGGILGICLAVVGFLLNFTNFYRHLSLYIAFTLSQINDLVLPTVGILFLIAVILTRTFSCCIGRCFEEEYIYPI